MKAVYRLGRLRELSPAESIWSAVSTAWLFRKWRKEMKAASDE